MNFNPRSPRGLRRQPGLLKTSPNLFQSTQPKRAATQNQSGAMYEYIEFQSTQPKRAATKNENFYREPLNISIHAAQEGCDNVPPFRRTDCKDFNPRSPRGLRPDIDSKYIDKFLFQSTQPKRAATIFNKSFRNPQPNFNPRSPRGLRLIEDTNKRRQKIFQSTQPKRAATGYWKLL